MKDEINEKNACEGTYQEEMAKDAESNGPPEDKIADIELNQESDKWKETYESAMILGFSFLAITRLPLMLSRLV